MDAIVGWQLVMDINVKDLTESMEDRAVAGMKIDRLDALGMIAVSLERALADVENEIVNMVHRNVPRKEVPS